MKADDILRQAAEIIEERGKLRDNAKGERSMARTVAAYIALRGPRMESELDGWIFMCVLKLARGTAGEPYLDDFSDLAGYGALGGECISEKHEAPPVSSVDREPSEATPKFPWGDDPAPTWARWAAQDESGLWWAYVNYPYKDYDSCCWFGDDGAVVTCLTLTPVDQAKKNENWPYTLVKLDEEGRPCPASTSDI